MSQLDILNEALVNALESTNLSLEGYSIEETEPGVFEGTIQGRYWMLYPDECYTGDGSIEDWAANVASSWVSWFELQNFDN